MSTAADQSLSSRHRVRLPLAADAEDSANTGSPCNQLVVYPGTRKGHRPFIVIVDRSRTLRKVVEIVLARAGYEVAGFSSGVSALSWLVATRGRLPQLIFVDSELSGVSAYQFVRRSRAIPYCARAAFVVLSRRETLLGKLRAGLVGAQEIVSKPFRTQDLLDLVRRYVGPGDPTAPGLVWEMDEVDVADDSLGSA
jgi:CheY-like chemotaxis protein